MNTDPIDFGQGITKLLKSPVGKSRQVSSFFLKRFLWTEGILREIFIGLILCDEFRVICHDIETLSNLDKADCERGNLSPFRPGVYSEVMYYTFSIDHYHCFQWQGLSQTYSTVWTLHSWYSTSCLIDQSITGHTTANVDPLCLWMQTFMNISTVCTPVWFKCTREKLRLYYFVAFCPWRVREKISVEKFQCALKLSEIIF